MTIAAANYSGDLGPRDDARLAVETSHGNDHRIRQRPWVFGRRQNAASVAAPTRANCPARLPRRFRPAPGETARCGRNRRSRGLSYLDATLSGDAAGTFRVRILPSPAAFSRLRYSASV